MSDASGKVAVSTISMTEFPYLSGVSSNIHIQVNICALGIPQDASYIGNKGTVIRNSGLNDFTLTKSATGTHVVNFGTTLASNQSVCNATVGNAAPMLITDGTQATTSWTMYTWNSSGVATDSQFSFGIILH